MKRILPLLCCCMILILCLAPMASASTIDPLDYEYQFGVEDEQAYLYVDAPVDYTYWQQYRDGELVYTYTGAKCKYASTESLLDNLDFYCYPWGTDTTAGIDTSSNQPVFVGVQDFADTFTLDCIAECTLEFSDVLSQSFTVNCYVRVTKLMEDASNTSGYIWDTTTNYLVGTLTIPAGGTYVSQRLDPSIVISKTLDDNDGNADAILIEYWFELNGIVDETASNKVIFTFINRQSLFKISVSDLYYQSVTTGETNKLLDDVNDKLLDLGTTMDEVLAAEQANGALLEELITGSQEDQDQADSMVDDSEQIQGDSQDKAEEGYDALDQLDQLDRPSVDDALGLPDILDGGTVAYDLNLLVQKVWDNELIYQMMLLAGTVMLGSYILYGKKV